MVPTKTRNKLGSKAGKKISGPGKVLEVKKTVAIIQTAETQQSVKKSNIRIAKVFGDSTAAENESAKSTFNPGLLQQTDKTQRKICTKKIQSKRDGRRSRMESREVPNI